MAENDAEFVTVRKAKTAFLYYQGDQLSKIRAELGPTTSMGDAMTEVSALVGAFVVHE
jgi:hypothetical protein